VWSLYVSRNHLLYHSFGCMCYTGGATYCALATLKLVGLLTPKSENGDKFVALLPGDKSLIGWCLRRQTETGGFQGRANKEADSCYAFWVGGSLQMLGRYNLCDKASLRSFLLSCQTKVHSHVCHQECFLACSNF
jgi:geranylgeranyl transferase type-1 subunit beta